MKTKKLLLIIITGLITLNVNAQTNIGGGISSNTIWSKEKSPYIITDNTVVFGSNTLTIEPGVVVKFEDDVQLKIQGTLVAIGNNSDSIVFTSNNSSPQRGSWSEINLEYHATCILDYVKLEYAYNALKYNYINTLSRISNSVFQYNNYAIKVDYGRGQFPITIDSVFFINNDIGIGGYYDEVKLINCRFEANRIGAELVESNVENCIFKNNTEIGLTGHTSIINNSQFVFNYIGLQQSFSGGSDASIMTGNIIKNNSIGLRITGNNPKATFSENIVCDNSNYNVVNTSTYSGHDLSNNCWCTTNSDTISSKIYDGLDDVSVGMVIFSPLFDDGLSFNIEDTISLCGNDSVIVNPNISLEGVEYIWKNLNTGDTISKANEIVIKTIGIYTLQAYTACNMITDTFNVINSIKPTAFFTLDTDKLCDKDTVLISYTGIGTENANYNWNFNSGNIISGSGQGDYQINWASSGLKSISLSVEENGCVSNLFTENIKVYQPNSSFFLDNVVCENQNTSIAFNGVASDSAIFDWDFDGANIVTESNETYLINWVNLGAKNVSLTINDNGCQSPQTIQTIEHNPIPTPTFSAPEKVCYYGTANIVYLGTASSSASYNWNFGNSLILSGTGEGPYDITWGNSGVKTVSLNVTEYGCSSDTSVSLSVNQQTQPISICMVSVDSSNHNMIVWEQPFENPYDSIIIYKETSQSDVYEKIYSHSSGNKTVFIDKNSNPAQNSSRYKIAVLDTCGYETAQSDYHKTMHLTINSGINGAWNLIWDGYEGLSYSTYNIYRGTSDDNMLKIAEQASNTFTYTDLTPPVGTVYYQIEIENPNSCNISNLKSSNNYYSSTRSNIVNSSQVNSIDNFSFEGVEIYPNPTNDKLYIKTIATDNYDMKILSLDGKLMVSYQNIQNDREFDISTLKTGMYLIKLTNNKKSMHMKLIKR